MQSFIASHVSSMLHLTGRNCKSTLKSAKNAEGNRAVSAAHTKTGCDVHRSLFRGSTLRQHQQPQPLLLQPQLLLLPHPQQFPRMNSTHKIRMIQITHSSSKLKQPQPMELPPITVFRLHLHSMESRLDVLLPSLRKFQEGSLPAEDSVSAGRGSHSTIFLRYRMGTFCLCNG